VGKIVVLFVGTAAAQSLSAALGPVLVRGLLGLPREMCPTGLVRLMMYGGYLALLASLVGVAAILVTGVRRSPWRVVALTVTGALALASFFTAITYIPPITALINAAARGQAGRVFDLMRWAVALLTACGAILGFVVGRRSPTRS